jgi:hypothetical protein
MGFRDTCGKAALFAGFRSGIAGTAVVTADKNLSGHAGHEQRVVVTSGEGLRLCPTGI